jgi:hypothetical protein
MNARSANASVKGEGWEQWVVDSNPGNNDSQIMKLIEMISLNQAQVTRMTERILQTPNIASGIKIPEIELPKFDGNIKNYKLFKDTFNSIIKRSKTSAIERFALLRSKLQGGALEAIDTLDLTEGNYPKAWEILDKRFNNQRLSIETNLNALMQFPET